MLISRKCAVDILQKRNEAVSASQRRSKKNHDLYWHNSIVLSEVLKTTTFQ